MRKLILTIIAIALITTVSYGQDTGLHDTAPSQSEEQETFRQHHIGSSVFMLFNLLPDPADYYQLSYGYHITQRDVFKVEAITWKYREPIGTYNDSEVDYPGKIKAYGIGAGYQRFHWKNAFTTVIATPFMQQFFDEDNEKIQKGFQLYIQLIAGYRLEFMEKRLFFEPAYALKYWPINTNFPDDFEEIENGKPDYKFEMNFNFGWRF